MPELDPIIHQPVRLRLMSALAALSSDASAEFTFLRKALGLTDGNLGAHLQKLESAGFIAVEKTFVNRKPRTFIALTKQGRAAFEGHIAALREILESANGSGKST